MEFPQKSAEPKQRVTRLAPSPTGALHLGNARTFLVNWALARQNHWKIVLRIEDLDGPRIKPGADRKAIDDLTWLGMDWDDGPFYQRPSLDIYKSAMASLKLAGLAYACNCTRSEIISALSAPHTEDHEIRYPGTCRPDEALPASPAAHEPTATSEPVQLDIAWRFRVPMDQQAVVSFVDRIAGPQCVNVQEQIGDFVIWTKAGLPSYQLAVVVDDIRQGVTDVVRGDDLLGSTGRQILLYHAMAAMSHDADEQDDGSTGEGVPPRWWHLPMVLGPDGRRLAKRHGDSRVAWYRQQGVSAEKIIGLLASWCGVCDVPEPMGAQAFACRFDIKRLPCEAVTFTAEMHQWLLA